MPSTPQRTTSSEAICKRTASLIFAFAFVWTVSDVTGKPSLSMESFPEQPVAGDAETGDPVTVTCKGWLGPNLTSLSFSIVHALDDKVSVYVFKELSPSAAVRNIASEPIACYASEPQCQGLTSSFWFYDNGSLTVTVAIEHFQCRLRGTWTCKASFKSPSAHISLELKSSLTFLGFSWPSGINLTSGKEEREDGMFPAMAGRKAIFTCRGNVGSPDAHFFFASSAYSDNTIPMGSDKSRNADIFNSTKESNFNQRDCLWFREATLEHTVTDVDDRMTFKCGVKGNHHSKVFTNSVTTLFVVNGSGTIWKAVGKPTEDVTSDPQALATLRRSTFFQQDCLDGSWLVFGMTAGAILTVVVIVESAHFVYRRAQS